jgi:hypothetical protein
MKTKTYIIIGVVIAVIVIAFFVFKGKSPAAVAAPVALGIKKDGTPYYESDVVKMIGNIRGTPDWYDKIKNSVPPGKTLDEALRGNATWMLEFA